MWLWRQKLGEAMEKDYWLASRDSGKMSSPSGEAKNALPMLFTVKVGGC